LGGVAWDYLNFVLGLKRLGHDVFYIEDSGAWPYTCNDATSKDPAAYDPRQTVEYLQMIMTEFGLSNKWAYRFPIKSEWFGLSEWNRTELLRSADLLINVSGTLERPERYRSVRRLVYVDTDPVFTQIDIAGANSDARDRVNTHDIHFTVGECLGADLPVTGHHWYPTKHPIVRREWDCRVRHQNTFTTVMNWTSYASIIYRGRMYGQKDIEFAKFVNLPKKVFPTTLEVALHKPDITWSSNDQRPTQLERLKQLGWQVVDATEVCPDFNSYRRYIQQSKGEWSVAKNGYVDGKSGWFSGRSGCYLAAGRPVIVQDTGFSQVLPVGEGILPFNTLEEAEAAIREVQSNYGRHAKAAQGLAEAYFDSDKVLNRLLEISMNN